MKAFVLICVFALLSASGGAQTAAPSQKPAQPSACPSPSATHSKEQKESTCASPPAPASAADRFPYPGEPPSPSPVPAVATKPATPHDDTAGKFPYPGDPAATGSGSSDSSADPESSSSSSGSSGADTTSHEGTGTERSVRRKLPKPERIQSNEDREAEDLTVAKFYRQTGNLQAAYLRSKDAVAMQPDDPEAHYALADVAQHLNKKEEAALEYSAYLRLDPEGDRVKSARKALATLQ